MRDIIRPRNEENTHKSFVGKVVVLGGDFRQIPLVVRKGSRYGHCEKCNKLFWLSRHCKVLKFSQNMRLRTEIITSNVNDIKKIYRLDFTSQWFGKKKCYIC